MRELLFDSIRFCIVLLGGVLLMNAGEASRHSAAVALPLQEKGSTVFLEEAESHSALHTLLATVDTDHKVHEEVRCQLTVVGAGARVNELLFGEAALLLENGLNSHALSFVHPVPIYLRILSLRL